MQNILTQKLTYDNRILIMLRAWAWESGSLSACFRFPLYLNTLEQKTPVKLEESRGYFEAMAFPSISERKNSMDSSPQCPGRPKKPTAEQRGVQQLEVGAVPQLSEPGIVFRKVLYLPTYSRDSGGSAHSS